MRVRGRSLCVILGVTLVASLVTASRAAASAPGGDPEPAIIGGGTVSSAPWGAQVGSSRGTFCSGSIIAARWVLTAAHCLGGTMNVKVGDVKLGSGQSAQGVKTYQNGDTGLIQLDRSITTGYAPLARAEPPVNATVEIYGWGGTCKSGCGLAPVLKKATVRVTRVDAGTERRIRAVQVNGTAWHGDSGGPMFYQGRQIGTCTGEAAGELIYPSVPNVLSWIRSITGVNPAP
jgi:secreted trypsin-like serine protease